MTIHRPVGNALTCGYAWNAWMVTILAALTALVTLGDHPTGR